MTAPRKVRILVNRKSGFHWSFHALQRAFDRCWDTPDTDLTYQFCQSAEDGRRKAARASEDGVDILLVVGGDGTVNTAGAALIGSKTVLGVIPMGSGNGFARHFDIPLEPEEAARALARATTRYIDVGLVNGTPFLVTCSMAWDAAIVRSFEKSPVRGILPYVLAGVYEFFDYKPQPLTAVIDENESLNLADAVVFTIANLTQYGGGALIAPHAESDDGALELVVVRNKDVPKLSRTIHKFFDGSIRELPEVIFRRFRSLVVTRDHSAQIQIDGGLIDAPARVEFTVLPKALRVLVPEGSALQRTNA